MLIPLRYVLMTLVLLTDTALSSKCNDDRAVLVDDMCVVYYGILSNWHRAKETCANHGMHLTTIQSSDQLETILDSLPPNSKLDCWTGRNDLGNEGQFVWDEDNRPIVEAFFRRQEDTLDQQEINDCLFVDEDVRLKVALCSEEKASLCMYRVPTPAYYFGDKNNRFLCHCMEGACDIYGYCYTSLGRCSTGWFGDECQFRSLSGDKYGPLGVLADNDDTTCSSEFSSPLIIKLNPESMFTWIRIIVEDPAHLQGLDIYFKSNDDKVVCSHKKERPVSVIAMDITCSDAPLVVDDVILTWEGNKRMCSIYVNGGRNFALLQSASIYYRDSGNVLLPVDGHSSPNDGCFRGSPHADNHIWQLTFTRPKLIHEIVIYRRPNSIGYGHMNGFVIEGYHQSGPLLFRYVDNGENAGKSKVRILTYMSNTLQTIIISVNDIFDQRHLELCEVETFGDCEPYHDGLFCNQTCSRLLCPHGECEGGTCGTCPYGVDSKGRCKPREIYNNMFWRPVLLLMIIISSNLLALFIIFKLRKWTKPQIEELPMDGSKLRAIN